MRKLGVCMYVWDVSIAKNYDDIFGIWDVNVWESQEKIGLAHHTRVIKLEKTITSVLLDTYNGTTTVYIYNY